MGGSHLAADLLIDIKPEIDIEVHEDYGLPEIAESDGLLVILSSYSGNTEEVLDAYEKTKAAGLPMAAISIGGKLLELAKKDGIPYIEMPDLGVQPRSALGLSLIALASLMGLDDVVKEARRIARELKPADSESLGKALSADLAGSIPIIYASAKNEALAFNWKIKFNETGKIPAFYNVVPELNHNEMTGFDISERTRSLSDRFHFIFLMDEDDHPRNKKRMENLETILKRKDLPATRVPLIGKTPLEKFLNSSILADWTAFHTASAYGLEPEQVPMVQDFKEMMK